MGRGRLGACLGVVLGVVLCAGCAPRVGPRITAPDGGVAFAPQQLRVHPLTTVAQTGDGQTRVVCYVELTDAWGHSVKWLGRFRVELYRERAGKEMQELVWDLDLSGPEENADAFDGMISRMYTLVLGGAPAWLGQTGGDGEGWATLWVTFLPLGDENVQLRDSLRVPAKR